MLVVKMLRFLDYFNCVNEWVNNDETKRIYRTKDSYFTRSTAILTFPRLMEFTLGSNKGSAQVALNDYFRDTDIDPVARQSLFEAREKISYMAFSDLSDKIVHDFYNEDDVKKHGDYYLFGVDGSIFQAPQGALETFGGQKSARCDSISAQARALLISDVLNRIIFSASLSPIAKGEREMFLDAFDEITNLEMVLFLFDRGFYSFKLVKALCAKEAKFLFRVKSKCQKDIDAANEPDQIIHVNGVKLRVINVILPNGVTEKLVTNIFDESYTVDDFAAIYEKRWGVETTYLMVKERLSIENFSSAKENLMLQDFYASIITYNMMEIACMEQEQIRKESGRDISRKHRQSANRNIATHEVRKCLISAVTETNPAIIAQKMSQLERTVLRFFCDIRPGRSNPRQTKFPNKKFPMNKKHNL